ncbi:tektin-2 isoform X2 [Chelonus insularis]|uniref:tektin-2 isoform X2 n=1 Tax=Chelonus insularis TaxID=460826 RepID=UPI00158B414D|nr:tektin-2 isoform X2 [Chelonus insularis]
MSCFFKVWLGLPDWYAKQWELVQLTDRNINSGFEIRNSARALRNESNIKNVWNTHINDIRLENRVIELTKWQEILTKLLNLLIIEKKTLNEKKIDAERYLESLQHPLEIVNQCISIRDCRRGTELTYDEPDIELKKELKLLESQKMLLTEKVQAAWEKLNELDKIEYKLRLDIENKNETLEIDSNNANLNQNSSDISYKPNALKSSKNSKTYETWLELCRDMKSLGEDAIKDTYSFCEILNTTCKTAQNNIEAQQDITDYVMRKRIYQTQRSKNEMEWQKNKTEKEMELVEKEIRRLEDTLRSKTNILKCAETRLESRTYRPSYELCRDESENGLKDEVLQIEQTKRELTNKINCAKATFNRLESLLIQLNRNLDDKQHSLMTDIMCLDSRSTLKIGNRTQQSNETNRNIQLTKLNDEIPLES